MPRHVFGQPVVAYAGGQREQGPRAFCGVVRFCPWNAMQCSVWPGCGACMRSIQSGRVLPCLIWCLQGRQGAGYTLTVILALAVAMYPCNVCVYRTDRVAGCTVASLLYLRRAQGILLGQYNITGTGSIYITAYTTSGIIGQYI